MIFVSGIHGAGKTYFCNIIKEKLGIKNYSASQLIAERRKKIFQQINMFQILMITKYFYWMQSMNCVWQVKNLF